MHPLYDSRRWTNNALTVKLAQVMSTERLLREQPTHPADMVHRLQDT